MTALQLHQAAHVVGEVLQPDPRLGPHQADAAHQRPAHVVALGAEHVLDPRANLRTGPVALLLALAERLAAMALAVDPALQPLLSQLRLDLRRAIGAVRPHAEAGVVRVENVLHHLAVVHRGAASPGNAAPACAAGPR